jgi:hypothetical protein
MYNVQECNVLYNKAVLCDYWYFNHMWKTCLYHDTNVNGRVVVCQGYRFYIFLRL